MLPFIGGVYRALVVAVPDADTIVVRLDLPFGLTAEFPLRVRSLYCAERGTAAGQAALQDALRLLPPGRTVRVTTYRTKGGRDVASLGRRVGDIEFHGPEYIAGTADGFVQYAAVMRHLGHDGKGIGARTREADDTWLTR